MTVPGDAFQHKLDAVFSKIDFSTVIADDMIIWGEQPDGSDHYKHITNFLQVTKNHNLKLNIVMLQDKTKHASFFGTTFTADGHKPEMKKLKPLTKCHSKKCQRPPMFLGQSLKYYPRLVDLAASLKEFEKKNVPFIWDLNMLKHLMPSKKRSPVFPYSKIMTPKNLSLCKQM